MQSRWPLLVLPTLDTWSNSDHNVVLIGDAAHGMTNHMAQGCATSMEDGAFLARCLTHVSTGALPLPSALTLYENARKPLARQKMMLSFLNGQIWMMPPGPEREKRDRAMAPEVRGEQVVRSSNTYGDPLVVREVFGYDAEEHAEREVRRFLGKAMEKEAWNTARKKFAGWWEDAEVELEELRRGGYRSGTK